MCDMVLKEMSYLSHNYYMRTASQIAQAYLVQKESPTSITRHKSAQKGPVLDCFIRYKNR